ncbi:MAG: hypothetical protein ACRDVM_02720 [Acidimicrobiia bacterium]
MSREEFARSFGFGISTNDETLAEAMKRTRPDPNQQYWSTLSRERAASYSSSWEACRTAIADETVPPESFHSAVDDLAERVYADPAVVEAQERWGECMAELQLGLRRFVSPEDMTAWLHNEVERLQGGGSDLDRLRDLEIELAVRNLQCEPELRAEIRRVAAQYQGDVIEQHSDVLERQRNLGGS